jgi:hypothetical protein
MAVVMIGIDPRKGSHTAAAIGPWGGAAGPGAGPGLGVSGGAVDRVGPAWPERTWAVEGAAGLGHLLAQQLVAAGEAVLDVQPKLAARVRLLEAGTPARTTPMTPGRSRSRRCARPPGEKSSPRTRRPC